MNSSNIRTSWYNSPSSVDDDDRADLDHSSPPAHARRLRTRATVRLDGQRRAAGHDSAGGPRVGEQQREPLRLVRRQRVEQFHARSQCRAPAGRRPLHQVPSPSSSRRAAPHPEGALLPPRVPSPARPRAAVSGPSSTDSSPWRSLRPSCSRSSAQLARRQKLRPLLLRRSRNVSSAGPNGWIAAQSRTRSGDGLARATGRHASQQAMHPNVHAHETQPAFGLDEIEVRCLDLDAVDVDELVENVSGEEHLDGTTRVVVERNPSPNAAERHRCDAVELFGVDERARRATCGQRDP